MYYISNVDTRLCHILRHRLDLVGEDCTEIYTIWSFGPRDRWKALKRLFSNTHLCQARWFPLAYWTVLIISFLGSIYSLHEFLSLFLGRRKRVTMWRKRKYYVLPKKFIKTGRLFGALVMFAAWMFLWYGIVNVSTSHMMPWLTINIFVLGLELLLWIIELCMGTTRITLRTMLSFALPIANFVFVECVRAVFEQAIANNDVEDLRLWPTSK